MSAICRFTSQRIKCLSIIITIFSYTVFIFDVYIFGGKSNKCTLLDIFVFLSIKRKDFNFFHTSSFSFLSMLCSYPEKIVMTITPPPTPPPLAGLFLTGSTRVLFVLNCSSKCLTRLCCFTRIWPTLNWMFKCSSFSHTPFLSHTHTSKHTVKSEMLGMGYFKQSSEMNF